jgi:hypothetical protein
MITRKLRVYSPKLVYIFRLNKVLIYEKVKGGANDLQIRNCVSGLQKILNIMPDYKFQGWPTKEIYEIS